MAGYVVNTSNTVNNGILKQVYSKLAINAYNSENKVLSQIKKTYDFTGYQKVVSVPSSFSGGVASGSIPTVSPSIDRNAVLTRKKVYAKIEIDREAAMASKTSEGAFFEYTKYGMKKCIESFLRNSSRILFGGTGVSSGAVGGDGLLGTTNTDITSGTTSIVVVETGRESVWEEQDIVNIYEGSDLKSTFLITAVSVNASTNVVTLTVSNVSHVANTTTNGLGIYMQSSKDAEPIGLRAIADMSGTATLYGLSYGRRWQMNTIDASSAGISADLLNQGMVEVERKFGHAPKLIVCSYKQYRKLLNLIEDQKRYPMKSVEKVGKGYFSFEALEFMSSGGPVPVIPERFVDDDRIYGLNTDPECLRMEHAPNFGWFEDNGEIIFPGYVGGGSSDTLMAIYGGYQQNFILPPAHFCIKNLA